jgi:hypothetical protein
MGPEKQGHDRYPCTSEESILLIYPTHEKKKRISKRHQMWHATNHWKESGMLFSTPQTRQKNGGFIEQQTIKGPQ